MSQMLTNRPSQGTGGARPSTRRARRPAVHHLGLLGWCVLVVVLSSCAWGQAPLRSDSFNVVPPVPWTATGPGQLRTWQQYELSSMFGRVMSPFVYSGGLHGLSNSFTSPAFATEGFVPQRVNQAAAAITYAAAANDTCWTILSSTNASIAGWTRIGTTAYYVNCQGSPTPLQPPLPANSVWLMGPVTIQGGAIVAVNDLRSGPQFLGMNGIATVTDAVWGAKGDGVTDDTLAFTSAIASLGSDSANGKRKGVVRVPTPKVFYVLSGTGITLPAGIVLEGSGPHSAQVVYTGSGTAVTLGGVSTALLYGTGIRNMYIRTTNVAANGVLLQNTSGAFAENVYLESVPSTSRGVCLSIDGSGAANLFSHVQNVFCNHWKGGYRLFGSGGGTVTTSVTCMDCNVQGDTMAGGYGVQVETNNGAPSGQGSRFIGGDLETVATGVNILGGQEVTFVGTRFEGNTKNVNIATGSGIVFLGCTGLNAAPNDVTDTSGNLSNMFVGCTYSGSPVTGYPNKLDAGLTLQGPLTLLKSDGGHRFILLSDVPATFGDLAIQAGPGSPSLGGSLVLRGANYSGDTGGVLIGLGGSGVRKFRVQDAALAGGGDIFTVDSSGWMLPKCVTFAVLGTLTPVTGASICCSDCVPNYGCASQGACQCAGGGTGTIAHRQNGVFVCPGG